MLRTSALCLAASLIATTTFAGAPSPAFPLKPSENNRYLVDQNNVPFLMAGDAPQAMVGNLSVAQAKFFIANRAKYGINALWVNLLCDSYTACNSDGTTFDGIQPFTTPGDLSTPNPAYFDRAAKMLKAAEAKGMVVLLDPIETGGWLGVLDDNGTTKARKYGEFLGKRFRDFPNIIWMSGNDFQSWRDDCPECGGAGRCERASPPKTQITSRRSSSTTMSAPRWTTANGVRPSASMRSIPIARPTRRSCRNTSARTSGRPSWSRPTTSSSRTAAPTAAQRRTCAGRNTGRR